MDGDGCGKVEYCSMALTIDSVLDDSFPDLVFHSHNQNKPTAERTNAVDTARTFFQMENTLLTMMRYVLLLLVVLTCFSECLLPVDARLHEQQQLRDTTDVVPLPNNNNYSNISMCERIHPEELPAECLCREKPPLGLVVECLKVFNSTFFNDTIGLKIDLDPCNPEGSSCSIDVTERNNNIDYPIERIRAGEEQDFPIPGLAVVVPGLGHVGMDVVSHDDDDDDDDTISPRRNDLKGILFYSLHDTVFSHSNVLPLIGFCSFFCFCHDYYRPSTLPEIPACSFSKLASTPAWPWPNKLSVRPPFLASIPFSRGMS